jgi:hypothetical protein
VAHFLTKEVALKFADDSWSKNPPTLLCNLICRECVIP